MGEEISLSVSMPLDSDGFLRRECPTCEREFKWLAADEDAEAAEPDAAGYFCPYCAIQAPPDEWHTRAQLEVVEGIAAREVMGPMLDQFKRSGFRVERNIPAAPPELTESDDMRRVEFVCHPDEPVKVLDEWTKPVHCLLCGQPASN